MLLGEALQFVLTAALLWGSSHGATTAAVKLCGRQLSEIMSKVCHSYNTPWNVPTVVEQPGGARRRRETSEEGGIVEHCCIIGCTWDQLSEYCYVSNNPESSEDLETHNIADRSAEVVSAKVVLPATVAKSEGSREVGSRETGRRGSGEQRREVGARGRARACWCRHKRRSGRRRLALMGNTEVVNNVRAAPVVGTVSPLITWGRTLNTDLPTFDRDRYAYVVYT